MSKFLLFHGRISAHDYESLLWAQAKSRGPLLVSPSYALSGERALYWRRRMALQSTEQLIATHHEMVITFTIKLKFSVTTHLSVGQL